MCSETQFRLGLMCESLMRALGVVLCARVRYSCKLSFYCDCLLTFIRLDTPEYTEPRSTPSMSLSVSKLIEEGGEPGRLLTGHLFAVNGGRSFGNAVDVKRGELHFYVKLLEPYDKPVPERELWHETNPQSDQSKGNHEH